MVVMKTEMRIFK